MKMRNLIWTLLSSFLVQSAFAETIDFAEEELAQESVLPVFAKKVVVRERAVKTAGRFEIGAGGGLNLVEPLYQQLTWNVTAAYHFNELHGMNLAAYFLSEELSNAGEDLRIGKGLEQSGNKFNANKAPTVGSMFFGNYQFSAYYGKVSVSMQKTMNLSLYGLCGLGIVNWSDTTELALDVGVGQKIYFTPNFGFRLDLTLAMYQGPDPTSPKTPWCAQHNCGYQA